MTRVLVMDQSGRVALANQAATGLLAVPPDRLLQSDALRFCRPGEERLDREGREPGTRSGSDPLAPAPTRTLSWATTEFDWPGEESRG
jgi:PAS domain-containing protein